MHFKFKDRLKVDGYFLKLYITQEEITTVMPHKLQSKATYYRRRHISQNDFQKTYQLAMPKDSRCVYALSKTTTNYIMQSLTELKGKRETLCIGGKFKSVFCVKDTTGQKWAEV